MPRLRASEARLPPLYIFLNLLWLWLLYLGHAHAASRSSQGPGGCFNLSLVRNAVLGSDFVFIGKILDLTQLRENDALFSETLVRPKESDRFMYFHYDHVGPAKRRRHSQETLPATNDVSSKTYVGRVHVKTVFKGRETKELEGREVSLGIQVGSQRVSCLRRLRALDTRIFFYTRKQVEAGAGVDPEPKDGTDPRNLVQTLMPLPPTLGILTTVRKTVKDEPCAQTHCGHGADCVVENGRPVCRCPESCVSGYAPVCGSDDVTYANECLLRQQACRNHVPVRVKRVGKCSDRSDPCLEKVCPFGARCNMGICECPPECPPQTEDETELQLCGSDGREYRSECELNREACLGARAISVLYLGKCDPCHGVQCPDEGICQLDRDRRPVCACTEPCQLDLNRPVCASNGRSYTNECLMRQDACRSRNELRMIYRGLCSSGVNPCDSVRCESHRHETCLINSAGVAECVCDMQCEPVFRPVCASDSKSYANVCELRAEACRTRTQEQLEVLHAGACGLGFVGADVDSEPPQLQPPTCNCNRLGSKTPMCDPATKECDCFPGVGGELCDRCLPGFWGFPRIVSKAQEGCTRCDCSPFGSAREDCEQMTGSCECKAGVIGPKCDTCPDSGQILGPEGCISVPVTQNLEEAASASLCDQVVCDYGAECQVRGDYVECACNTRCDKDEDDMAQAQVCGSDGVTYDSLCRLRLSSCQKQMHIRVSEEGPCNSGTPMEGEVTTEAPDGFGVDAFALTWRDDDNRQNSSSGSTPSSGMKWTRHLQPQLSSFHDSFQRTFHNHRLSISTVEMRSYLGDSCQSSSECVTTFSLCLHGTCVCREGYYEDAERIQCKPTVTHAPKPLSCIRNTCHPTSMCLDHLNGTYSCVCPLGTTLGTVEEVESCAALAESPTPLFTGKSTIWLGKLAGSHKLSLEMEVTPFLDHQHGILLFASQYANGSAYGDFVSLALIDGHVEFRYDLGEGPLKLRSAHRLQSGAKYFIGAKRYNRDGLLQVNEEEEVQASAPGQDKSLDLGEVGFMGHVPLNSTILWELVGTSQGFVGCINALRVGRRPVAFASGQDPLVQSMKQVYQCVKGSTATTIAVRPPTTTPFYPFMELQLAPKAKTSPILPARAEIDHNPCSTVPCKNGGHCWRDNAQKKGFRCVCHPLYSGKLCETKLEGLGLGMDVEAGMMLDFRGSSYLQLPQIEKHARQLSLELWVLARSRNGLLLYSGESPGKGDFVALRLRQGHVEFLFELGSGVGNATWPELLVLNKWHWIQVMRSGREARLQVDGGTPQIVKSPPTLSELNLELPLYLGGLPDINILHRRLDVDVFEPFDGVLQYIRVNGVTYHREIARAVRERLVHKYEGPPCGSSVSSCLNGGSCFPRLASFSCLCSPLFIGDTCDKRTHAQVGGPLRFDGDNFVRFPKKVEKRIKVQRQNRIEIVFRTQSDSSGVLFWTGQTRTGHESRLAKRGYGYVGLFLTDQHLELRVSLGARKNKKPVVIRSKARVADGRWHEAVIERRRRLVVFQVDGIPPQRATAPVGSNVLHSDGRVWIGGVGPSVLPGEIPPNYHEGFRGCVDLVRINMKRVPLAKIGYATGTPFCNDDD